MNAGEQTIAWLYDEQLQVDDEWAVRTPGGFRWWADQQAQTIEVIGQEEGGPGGATGYFIAVQTELLRSVELDDARVAELNDVLMLSAAMTGVVYDEDRGLLNLCSLVAVHDDNAEWMRTLIGTAALHSLFSKEQRDFYAAHAPAGIPMDSLVTLGPLFLLRAKHQPKDFGRRIVVEMWLYPDGSRILEISTKCQPGEAFQAGAEFKAYLAACGIVLTGKQQAKTKSALEFFGKRLAAEQRAG